MPRPRLVPAHALRAAVPGAALPEWARRHNRAVFDPQGFELPIVLLWRAIVSAPDLPVSRQTATTIRARYAAEHRHRYGSPVTDDNVIGEALAAALAPDGTAAERLNAAADLLNGEIGRLDGGILSGLLVAAAARAGVTL
jgi:hypothetical protein